MVLADNNADIINSFKQLGQERSVSYSIFDNIVGPKTFETVWKYVGIRLE